MTAALHLLPSIQGERLRAAAELVTATDAAVADWLAKASDGAIACRMRARHTFPFVREIVFVEENERSRWWVRRPERCLSCEMAVQTEIWTCTGRGKYRRWMCEERLLSYEPHPVTGEIYLVPKGQGRMLARQVRNAVVTDALRGQTIAELRARARAYAETA